jgi:hypothetical protein
MSKQDNERKANGGYSATGHTDGGKRQLAIDLSEISAAMVLRLPPTFTSLYRLLLRATSASVLHHTSATRGLRQLWRPTFREASKVFRRLNDESCEKTEREKSLEWLRVWERQSLYPVSVDRETL